MNVVYDLSVAVDQVFFAGGVLVHNCPDCNDLDGEVVPVGQLFDGEYDQPPAHPACRCTVVSGDDEEAA